MPRLLRETPFIGADDGVGLPILKRRHEWAVDKLGELIPKFDDLFVLQVCNEIGLDETVTYSPDGESLAFDLTSLQAFSLASALSACLEMRGERPRKRRKPRA